MTDINEIGRAVYHLDRHPECFAWLDFGDKGNPCTGPYKLSSLAEIIEDATALAAVKIVMPKCSVLHNSLARKVAKNIGCKYVTYDWLIKVTERILVLSYYNDFMNMLALSLAVRTGMKQRGLSSISKIEEAFV